MAQDDHHNRMYPDYPRIGIGVVVVEQNQVLLVKRGNEPQKGVWTVPGGLIRLGESAINAAIREVNEECNIHVDILNQIDYFEFIEKAHTDIKYHYIVLEFLARYRSGELKAQSDAADCRWFTAKELTLLHLTRETGNLIKKAFVEINHY